jgi:hypothetical protein
MSEKITRIKTADWEWKPTSPCRQKLHRVANKVVRRETQEFIEDELDEYRKKRDEEDCY